MASNWYHSFSAEFSFVVVATFIAVIAAAYLIGRWSVRIAPRRTVKRREAVPANMPKYARTKAKKLTSMFRKQSRNMEFDNSAIIMFRSETFDRLIAAIGAGCIAYVFTMEHVDGLTQWFINHLSSSDSAAWGDILAFMTIGFLFVIFLEVAKYAVRLGQIHKARSYADEFVAEKTRPVFGEYRSVAYIVSVIAFFVKEDAKAKKANMEKKNETKVEPARKNHIAIVS